MLQLTFDQNVLDASRYQRSTPSSGILYDHVDSMLGAAAYFDGDSFIEVPSFMHLAIGDINSQDVVPSLSMAMWIKVTMLYGIPGIV